MHKKDHKEYSLKELETMLENKKADLSETFTKFVKRVSDKKLKINLEELSKNGWDDLEQRYLELVPAIEQAKDFLSIYDNQKNIYCLIDDSGSMMGSPINQSIQSAFILYAASQDFPDVNVHAYTWGRKSGLEELLSKDMSASNVSKELSSLIKNGGHGEAYLAPAINDLSDIIADQSNEQSTAVLIYSDGDLYDPEKAKGELETLCALHSDLSIDSIIMRPSNPIHNEMNTCLANSQILRNSIFTDIIVNKTIGKPEKKKQVVKPEQSSFRAGYGRPRDPSKFLR